MDEKKKSGIGRKLAQAGFFVAVMLLAFYVVFHGQDPGQVREALLSLSPLSLGVAVAAALFFVSAEGAMIWYLLRSMGGKSGLARCIGYSFIGFFYSGITPSATGGQPVQLYYMKKDGNSLSASSVVLMTVALVYKLVLVLIGLGLLLFWNGPLKRNLEGYYSLYLVGLSLNLILVAALLGVMAVPLKMKKLLRLAQGALLKHGILKPRKGRLDKADRFIDSYQDAVAYLWRHPGKVLNVVAFTFLQRGSVFFLTYVVYRGFSLTGAGLWTILFLQASVIIAVDMLPVPGAQGITELMYKYVFAGIFPEGLLMPSLYVTRGISFYFLLLAGLAAVLARMGRDSFHRKFQV